MNIIILEMEKQKQQYNLRIMHLVSKLDISATEDHLNVLIFGKEN